MKTLYHVVFGLLAISDFAKPNFRQVAVAALNKLRAKHHAPALAETSPVDQYAQQWAQEMAKTGNFSYRGNKASKFGETAERLTNHKVTDSEAVLISIKKWYSQESNFDYNNPEKPKGHVQEFTQMVWKNTKHVGIGVARSSSVTYVCVNYDPPGNLRESYPENVLKP